VFISQNQHYFSAIEQCFFSHNKLAAAAAAETIIRTTS